MRLQEIVVEVSGMNGLEAEKKVEAALRSLPGVRSVRIDGSENRAVVTGDTAVAAPESLRAAIQRAGFAAGEIWFAE